MLPYPTFLNETSQRLADSAGYNEPMRWLDEFDWQMAIASLADKDKLVSYSETDHWATFLLIVAHAHSGMPVLHYREIDEFWVQQGGIYHGPIIQCGKMSQAQLRYMLEHILAGYYPRPLTMDEAKAYSDEKGWIRK